MIGSETMDYEKFVQNFSANLRQRRMDAGLTMAALADHLYIDKGTLGYYERGKTLPNIHTAYQIAQKLGCTIDELIGENRTSSRFCDFHDEERRDEAWGDNG